jgi:hypothetical protein
MMLTCQQLAQVNASAEDVSHRTVEDAWAVETVEIKSHVSTVEEALYEVAMHQRFGAQGIFLGLSFDDGSLKARFASPTAMCVQEGQLCARVSDALRQLAVERGCSKPVPAGLWTLGAFSVPVEDAHAAITARLPEGVHVVEILQVLQA